MIDRKTNGKDLICEMCHHSDRKKIMRQYSNEWIDVEENPPEIGQRVIALDSLFNVVYSLVLMEDGWYFDYPDQNLNYKSMVAPILWFPAPVIPQKFPGFVGDDTDKIDIKLDPGQNGYDVVAEYIERYWDHVSHDDVILYIGISSDGEDYYRFNEIACVNGDGNIEFADDWWEGERYIQLYGIKAISDLKISGGLFDE